MMLLSGVAKQDAAGHMQPCSVTCRSKYRRACHAAGSVPMGGRTCQSSGIWTCHRATATLTPHVMWDWAPADKLRRQWLAQLRLRTEADEPSYSASRQRPV